MNNNYRHNTNKYIKDLDKMVQLVERDHGGCDDENCSIALMLSTYETSQEEIVHWWACSGAADDEFISLYEKHEKSIKKELK